MMEFGGLSYVMMYKDFVITNRFKGKGFGQKPPVGLFSPAGACVTDKVSYIYSASTLSITVSCLTSLVSCHRIAPVP
jgi:hypothetical protein